jgi:hypothetical protein
MTTQEALSAVRTATHDYLTAVATNALDEEELDWLDWLRVRSVERAREAGIEYQAVKMTIVEGMMEVAA